MVSNAMACLLAECSIPAASTGESGMSGGPVVFPGLVIVTHMGSAESSSPGVASLSNCTGSGGDAAHVLCAALPVHQACPSPSLGQAFTKASRLKINEDWSDARCRIGSMITFQWLAQSNAGAQVAWHGAHTAPASMRQVAHLTVK